MIVLVLFEDKEFFLFSFVIEDLTLENIPLCDTAIEIKDNETDNERFLRNFQSSNEFFIKYNTFKLMIYSEIEKNDELKNKLLEDIKVIHILDDEEEKTVEKVHNLFMKYKTNNLFRILNKLKIDIQKTSINDTYTLDRYRSCKLKKIKNN